MGTAKRLTEGNPLTQPGNTNTGSAPEGAGFKEPLRRTGDAAFTRATGAGSTVSMAGTEDIRDGTPSYPLGTSQITVPSGITTDTTGPAAGGIDVNYTVGAGNTGVEVLITARDDPHTVYFQGHEADSTPFRIEAADFDDGVGPGTGVNVDVYVRGYKGTWGAATGVQVSPWAAVVQGATA